MTLERLNQQFDSGTLHILREAVLAHAVAAGMADDRAADVMVAVHELAANAVRHGGGAGRVQMRVTQGELVFQVSDPGTASGNGRAPGGAVRTQHSGGAPTRSWPFQPGHGLWLVRRIADRISMISRPAGSQVTVVFAIVPSDVPDGPANSGRT